MLDENKIGGGLTADIDPTKFEWTEEVTKPDREVEVNGFKCHEIIGKATGVDKKNPDAKVEIVSHYWYCPKTADLAELVSFRKQFADVSGIDESWNQNLFTANLFSRYSAALTKITQALKQAKGFPVKTTIEIKSTEAAGGQGASQMPPEVRAMMGLDKTQGKGELNTLFSISTEVESIKKAEIDKGKFEIPEGYKKKRIKGQENKLCIDTDNGENPETPGLIEGVLMLAGDYKEESKTRNVEIKVKNAIDYCKDDNTLVEYYCGTPDIEGKNPVEKVKLGAIIMPVKYVKTKEIKCPTGTVCREKEFKIKVWNKPLVGNWQLVEKTLSGAACVKEEEVAKNCYNLTPVAFAPEQCRYFSAVNQPTPREIKVTFSGINLCSDVPLSSDSVNKTFTLLYEGVKYGGCRWSSNTDPKVSIYCPIDGVMCSIGLSSTPMKLFNGSGNKDIFSGQPVENSYSSEKQCEYYAGAPESGPQLEMLISAVGGEATITVSDYLPETYPMCKGGETLRVRDDKDLLSGLDPEKAKIIVFGNNRDVDYQGYYFEKVTCSGEEQDLSSVMEEIGPLRGCAPTTKETFCSDPHYPIMPPGECERM